MTDRAILEKLLKIAENQQKLIVKLAQNYSAPPQDLPEPNHPDFHDAEVIMNALPPAAKGAVASLDVKPAHDPAFDGEVLINFHPGLGTDEIFTAVENTVKKLQLGNLLKGRSYLVREV